MAAHTNLLIQSVLGVGITAAVITMIRHLIDV
jgi:hypothetical protein